MREQGIEGLRERGAGSGDRGAGERDEATEARRHEGEGEAPAEPGGVAQSDASAPCLRPAGAVESGAVFGAARRPCWPVQ